MRSFVGADAHIGPLKCCDFASDFRENAQFRRADRVVRPYDAKSKPNAITPIRPYTGRSHFLGRVDVGIDPYGVKRKILRFARHFAGAKTKPCTITPIRPRTGVFPFWRVGRCGHRPLRRGMKNAAVFRPHTRFFNTGCRGGRLCPPLFHVPPAASGPPSEFLYIAGVYFSTPLDIRPLRAIITAHHFSGDRKN